MLPTQHSPKKVCGCVKKDTLGVAQNGFCRPIKGSLTAPRSRVLPWTVFAQQKPHLSPVVFHRAETSELLYPLPQHQKNKNPFVFATTTHFFVCFSSFLFLCTIYCVPFVWDPLWKIYVSDPHEKYRRLFVFFLNLLFIEAWQRPFFLGRKKTLSPAIFFFAWQKGSQAGPHVPGTRLERRSLNKVAFLL